MRKLNITEFIILIIAQILLGVGIFYAISIKQPNICISLMAIFVWLIFTIPLDVYTYIVDIRGKSK
jgi:uncharacterized Tic20 family protein